jgi:pimeloyl-ACP methyl ester carboxylesterase
MFESMIEGIVSDAAVEFNGFAYSLGSTLVDLDEPLADTKARLRRVGALGKPSIALWGTADTDVPYRNHETLLECVPQCVLHTFEDESHMFFQKEELVPRIASIIAEFVLAPAPAQ